MKHRTPGGAQGRLGRRPTGDVVLSSGGGASALPLRPSADVARFRLEPRSLRRLMTLTSFAYFWGLCLAQGAIVLGPGALRSPRLAALRAHWLMLALPAGAVTAATFLPPVASMLAVGLSSLALVLVPPLAVFGIGWAMRWRDRRLVPVVPALLAVGWATPGSLVGQAALLLLV